MAISSAATAAFLSTGLISLAPNVLLFLFPNYAASSDHNKRGGGFLSLGQAVAVGGLMGDVFLHTLPDCFADAIHGSDGTSGEDVGLRVLTGFAVFLILDVIVRSFEGGGGHDHRSHSGGTEQNNTKASNDTQKSQWRLLCSSAVLLNLFGDALHNFTDGLAIGASFAASDIETSSSSSLDNTTSIMAWMTSSLALLKSRGGLASVSVLLHEIPHELGDFATLVNAGMSRNMAIGMQFVTAIAAIGGTAVGLFSSQIIDGLGHDVLLPFTAGGFIYLACTTILPEILESDVSIYGRLMQICSFGLGLFFMYAVILLEQIDDEHTHHSHHGHSHHGHNHINEEL